MKTLSIVLALAFALSGCQNYIDGSSRTFGQFTDDAGIQTAVKAKLVGDEEVKGMPINVEVNRSVVSLYGRVSSDYLRNKAVKLAGEVKGVARVEDRLTLVQPSE